MNFKNVWIIWKKEVKIGFASPTAYAGFTVFLLISGWLFWAIVRYAAMSSISPLGMSHFDVMQFVFRPLFENLTLILLFLTPFLTMKLFSEEKRTRTIELLFSYPIGDLDLLLGKFLGAVTLLAFILLPTVLYPIFLQIKHLAQIQWPVLMIQYLGMFLMGGAFISVGAWISSLTENTAASFVVTLGVLLMFWMLSWGTNRFSTSKIARVLHHFSLLEHFTSFSTGVLSLSNLTFYLLFVLFFLYLTYQALQSRVWQGAKE
ncbi:MAG: ABC transporter permease [Candidatus Eremiobacteraeota bacterium]|jgi:ABC-2 type transport system permease protein|nr:ABC transporter permease [Candidatus Eremiobacteraeota bacterium]MCL5056260.1 ABC transporter permease [Bacillota bacterium]